MATVPNGIGVSVRYEYLLTILHLPLLSVIVSVSVNTSLLWTVFRRNHIITPGLSVFRLYSEDTLKLEFPYLSFPEFLN